MKLSNFSWLSLPILALAMTFATGRVAQAQTQTRRFVCGQHQGFPATLVLTKGNPVPIIQWTSDYFSGSGYNPQTRCKQVSARFQQYYESGDLKYLRTGIVNNQPVVCTADRNYGKCKGLLFTLKPTSDPDKTLERLIGLRVYASSPIKESSHSSPSQVYIDVEASLKALDP